MSGNTLISWERMGELLAEVEAARLEWEMFSYFQGGACLFECNIIHPMTGAEDARLVGHATAPTAPDAVWLAYQQAGIGIMQ